MDTLLFRISGKIPNLKNEHVPAERRKRDGSGKVPFIRRTARLVQWMTAHQGEFKRQLEKQVPPDERETYPRDKQPFRLRVIFWRSSLVRDADRDGQLNTLLDTLQGVVFKNDAYCCEVHFTCASVPRGLEYTDIALDFVDAVDSAAAAKSLIPEAYVLPDPPVAHASEGPHEPAGGEMVTPPINAEGEEIHSDKLT